MDYEAIGNGLKWIGIGIAAWSVCKYVIRPLINRKGIAMILHEDYNSRYKHDVEQRAELAAKLGREGKSTKEISEIVDSIVPLKDFILNDDDDGKITIREKKID